MLRISLSARASCTQGGNDFGADRGPGASMRTEGWVGLGQQVGMRFRFAA